ncbi:MAG TPA: cytochrome C [Gammaproteobacteria bacterium]|nr:cytochrome C [Gammaproteobacteria bacterium]
MLARLHRFITAVMILALAPLAFAAATSAANQKMVAHGRHLVMITGCNDCHTPGYGNEAGQVPERLWLTGERIGWLGPWGTTYAVNLRLLAASLDEKQWIEQLRTTKARPPMPWYVFASMSNYDLASIYRYLRALGPAGGPAPAWLPPGKKPSPPYFEFGPPAAPPPAAGTH